MRNVNLGRFARRKGNNQHTESAPWRNEYSFWNIVYLYYIW